MRSPGRWPESETLRPTHKSPPETFYPCKKSRGTSILPNCAMDAFRCSLSLSLSCFIIETNLIGFGNQESDMQRPSNLRAIRSRGIIQGENFWCVAVVDVFFQPEINPVARVSMELLWNPTPARRGMNSPDLNPIRSL